MRAINDIWNNREVSGKNDSFSESYNSILYKVICS